MMQKQLLEAIGQKKIRVRASRQTQQRACLHIDSVLAVLFFESTHGLGQMSLLDDGVMSQLSYCHILVLDFALQQSRSLHIV